MPENNEIEIRSDEVQEILSATPIWMIRWGISLIFGLILMLIFISWFIKYPDVVQGQAILTTVDSPVKLVSKSNGYIEKIYFENNSQVKEGEIIAEITNPANKKSIDHLNQLLNNFQLNELEKLLPSFEKVGELGEIQQEFSKFLFSLKKFYQLSSDGYHQKSLRNIDLQIVYNRKLAKITKGEVALLNSEKVNAAKKYKSDSLLYHKGVISKNQFFINQSEFLRKKQQLINIEKSLINHQIAIANFQKQKSDLTKVYEDNLRGFQLDIESGVSVLKNYTKNWQQTYTISSPIEGNLAFLRSITTNEFINAQEPLFAVAPKNQEYISNIQVSPQGYGKVATGQTVRIKLDNYPYQEFGQLVGQIESVSQLAGKQGYFVQVKLVKELTTTYKKEIEYSPNMMGIAEIVTDDLRLIDRVFNKFRKIIDK